MLKYIKMYSKQEQKMNKNILEILSSNARADASDIATMLGMSKEAVENEIKEMENSGIIRGYKCVIDFEKIETELVSAIIELTVTPKAEFGFEEVAARIAKYPEVEGVSLMSGACDLTVTVTGKTFHEVSSFVAKELSTIDAVTSTRTQFIMKRYKEFGIDLTELDGDGRGKILL